MGEDMERSITGHSTTERRSGRPELSCTFYLLGMARQIFSRILAVAQGTGRCGTLWLPLLESWRAPTL
jgi:hypothetical protein